MDYSATDPTSFPAKDYAANDDMQDFGETPQHNVKEEAINKAQNFRNYAGEKATALKQEASVKLKKGAEKAKELHHTAEDYVRENPTKSVLGALGAGVIIGLIMRR